MPERDHAILECYHLSRADSFKALTVKVRAYAFYFQYARVIFFSSGPQISKNEFRCSYKFVLFRAERSVPKNRSFKVLLTIPNLLVHSKHNSLCV